MAGILLVAGEAVGYIRGGYDSAFWRLTRDDQLDHIARNTGYWWWISIWELVGVFFMTGGVVALASLLAEQGEPVLAFAAVGGYLVGLIGWVFGLVIQTTALSAAAAERAESGVTPVWIQPFWNAAYLAEGAWIVAANLAYAVIGLAIVGSGLLPGWAGWTALALGVAIAIVVVATRNGFPQLAGLAPFIIGVAAVLESF